jgi:para-aminobenzoate synthetase component II
VILIIDNYDSFVHNIARYVRELGHHANVVRNDEVPERIHARGIIISPGPCSPNEAGASLDVIRRFTGTIPILGVCLGHQAIGQAFGGKVVRARHPMHGESSRLSHDNSTLYKNLPQNFAVGRYHSLIVEQIEHTPLHVTARSDDGEIMGLQHKVHPTFGVQFHPESILTEHGYEILRNFLRVAA